MRKLLLTGLLILMLVFTGIAAAQPDRPARPWIGISVEEAEDGVAIREVVPDSPAAEAGLEVGDIIQGVDGDSLTAPRELVRLVRGSEVGATHTFTVLRGDETLDVTVTFGERPAGMGNRDQIEIVPPMSMDEPHMMMMLMGVMIEVTDEGWQVTQVLPEFETPLEEGDIIVSIKGQSVDDLEQPFKFDFFIEEGEPLEVAVLRDGEEVTLEVDTAGMFANAGGMAFGTRNRIVLGVQYQFLNEEIAEEEGIEQTEGALIRDVLPGTPAEEAGLQAGDVILSVNGTAVNEENALVDLLSEAGETATVTLEVWRDGETRSVEVTLEPQAFMPPDIAFSVPAMPIMPGEMPNFMFPPAFFGDLGGLLGDFEFAPGSSVDIECSGAEGSTLSLHLEVNEAGDVSGSFNTEGLGVDGLENLDLSALNCELNSEAESTGSDA